LLNNLTQKMKSNYLLYVFAFSIFVRLEAQIIFTDVTVTANLSFNAETVESIAWGDYDNDGDQDIFFSTNGLNKLMRNDGNDIFTDVGIASGLTHSFPTTGCVFGDFDNDGNLDLFIVSVDGINPDLLYKNLGSASGFSFQSILGSQSGITDNITRKRGVSLLDYNRDGLLDIYVNSSKNDFLYKNLGNFQFQNVSSIVGINETNLEIGVVPTDINNDGWIDIFTGNRSSVQNKLYLNDGTGNFAEISNSAGIDAVGLGMGVISFDYDNDLDMDLYWTTWPHAPDTTPLPPFQPNAFYQNQGNLTFLNKTVETGTEDTSGWGISCNVGDIDNDRFEDFFVSNGFDPSSTQSILFKNINGTAFQDITNSVFGDITWDARGVAFADYDNDGDQDIILTGGPGVDTKLWRNDSTISNNWVTLNLEGTINIISGLNSNINAIGARVEVTAGGLTTVKEVSGGAGRGSFNSLPLEFGLGSSTSIDNVKVRWPDGNFEVFTNININQINQIKEGEGTLSLGDFSQDETINIFPNPFMNKFNINISGISSIRKIKIYNALGQVIFEDNYPKNNKTEIELNNNYKGLLILVLELTDRNFVRKLIKY